MALLVRWFSGATACLQHIISLMVAFEVRMQGINGRLPWLSCVFSFASCIASSTHKKTKLRMATTPFNDPEPDTEKSIGIATVNSTPPSHHNHNHHLHARSRLRHFLHPSGTRVHIADSPIEADNLHRQLSNPNPNSNPDPNSNSSFHSEPFSIYISGSPEHISAVQESQSHHEARQSELQKRHGEVWEQFTSVQGELEALSRELGRVTSKGVSLDGHFGKFGYSARIKSYDDGEESSPGRSGASSPTSGRGGEAEPLKLFKVPVVRQYFHKGILWRASSSEEVRSFELFVDLLYVGIIAINGDAAAEHPTGYSLLKFISELFLEDVLRVCRPLLTMIY
jgi:hypothetical protein